VAYLSEEAISNISGVNSLPVGAAHGGGFISQ
jgi:hypothetical protein